MGKFGNFLNMAGSSIIGGVTAGIGKGITGLFGGIGSGARQRKLLQAQEQAQMRLNEHAAKLNYDFGEMAANNAFERQMKMYERSYEDQSYKAMRKQMEDAGLSVGLMYGGAGAGGAGGATSGAPMGATGGAEAGNAGTAIAAAVEQELGLQRMGLEIASLKQDIENKKKTGENIDANTENLKEDAALKKAQTTTENETRELKVRKLFEETKGTWIENARKKYEDEFENTPHEERGMKIADAMFGEHSVVGERLRSQKGRAETFRAIQEAFKAQGDTTLIESLKKVNEARAETMYMEAIAAILQGNAAVAQAKCREIEVAIAQEDLRWKTGEKVTWKTYYDAATQGVQALGTLLGGVGVGKAVGKVLQRKDMIDVPPMKPNIVNPTNREIQGAGLWGIPQPWARN